MQWLKALKLILGFTLLSSVAWARVETKNMKLLQMPTASSDESWAQMSQQILPSAISNDDSSRNVVAKIIDNSFAYWFDHSGIKDTSVGKAATQIEKKMKADVDLGADSNKISHKLSFKVLASQALAKLEYTGWFKAAFNYDARAAKAEAEVLENISNNKDLVVSHSITSAESKSQVSLRWNW